MSTVTVLMPVHNAAEYLREAIESVLDQSFCDFDFIIIDDGSTDESAEIVRSYTDNRISFYRNQKNSGVAATLNEGIERARSTYIVRMDSDDVCDPDRLMVQVRFMDENPSVGVSGSWVWNFNSSKKFLLKYPVGQDCIEAFFLFANPLCHPSVALRRDLLIDNGLVYDEGFAAAQDYDLWSRCARYTAIENIGRPLVSWRRNRQSVTWGKSGLSNRKTKDILRLQLERLNIHPVGDRMQFHREVGNGSGAKTLSELREMHAWLESLLHANSRSHVFSEDGMKQAAAFVWFRSCLNTSGLGLRVIKEYLRSPLRKYHVPERSEIGYLLANALLKINREATGRVSGGSPEDLPKTDRD